MHACVPACPPVCKRRAFVHAQAAGSQQHGRGSLFSGPTHAERRAAKVLMLTVRSSGYGGLLCLTTGRGVL